MAGRPVLIVDGDAFLRRALAEQLRLNEEFAVTACASAAEALEAAGRERFDLAILDAELPDMDGRALCRALRRRDRAMPIVMLTGAAAGGEDSVRGPDPGADDHVAKPFRLGELLARARAQLRRRERGETAPLAIGPYTLRPAAGVLVHEETGAKRRLTGKEAAILEFLCRAGARAVTRQVLLNEVWGYNAAVETHTLETHIYRLRRKIEEDPSAPRLLVTEPGGYRLDP